MSWKASTCFCQDHNLLLESFKEKGEKFQESCFYLLKGYSRNSLGLYKQLYREVRVAYCSENICLQLLYYKDPLEKFVSRSNSSIKWGKVISVGEEGGGFRIEEIKSKVAFKNFV